MARAAVSRVEVSKGTLPSLKVVKVRSLRDQWGQSGVLRLYADQMVSFVF